MCCHTLIFDPLDPLTLGGGEEEERRGWMSGAVPSASDGTRREGERGGRSDDTSSRGLSVLLCLDFRCSGIISLDSHRTFCVICLDAGVREERLRSEIGRHRARELNSGGGLYVGYVGVDYTVTRCTRPTAVFVLGSR